MPACEKCNGGKSLDDQYLTQFALVYGSEKSRDGDLVGKKILRSIYEPKKQKFRRKLHESLTPIEVYTASGIYLGPSFKIRFDKDRIKSIIEKIVKGLFWHITKTKLPKKFVVYYSLFGQNPSPDIKDLEKHIMDSPVNKIGDNAFCYRFNIPRDMRGFSIWRFDFYGAISFFAYTVRVNKHEKQILKLQDIT